MQLVKKQRILLLATVLMILLTATFFTWKQVKSSTEGTALYRFEQYASRDVANVQSALNFYISALYSAQGLYEVYPPASQAEFSNYFKRLIRPDRYPGILAMVFVEKAGGQYVIKYVEPLVGNESAVGVDLYALADRRIAIEDARDTGQITATPKVLLFASGKNRPGTVLFVPLYKAGASLETTEQRRSAIIGELDVPIVVQNLFDHVLAETRDQNIALEVFDGTDMTEDHLYYDSDETKYPLGAYTSRFTLIKQLKVADRVWTLKFYALPEFKLSLFAELAPMLTLIIGTLFSLLIAFVIYALTTARDKAILIAKDITKELESVNKSLLSNDKELSRKNTIINEQLQSLLESKKAMLNLLQDLRGEKEKLADEKTKAENLTNDLKKFKLALDNASDQVVITDGEGIVVYANAAVEKITGYNPEEALGKKAGVLWKVPMPIEYYKNLWHTIKEQKKTFIGEIQNRRKNGQLYTALISISPVLDNSGNVPYFVGIERDITREKEIDQAKSEFISLASHQMRTPLTAISWYTEMLLDGDAGKLSVKQENYFNEIYTAGRQINKIIKSFLHILRLEAGTVSVNPIALDVADMSRTVVKESKLDIEKKHLRVTERYQESLPTVHIDQELVRVVLQNLVTNAIKYTREKGEIGISMDQVKRGATIDGKTAEGNSLVISVHDTGIGIAAGDRDKIFDKFFRSESAKLLDPNGNGLGLYMARKMMDIVGGKIWFESEEGRGATFYVLLPVDEKNLV